MKRLDHPTSSGPSRLLPVSAIIPAWLAALFAICLWVLMGAETAFAQTMPSLYESRAGNINFTGVPRSLRTATNDVNACSIVSAATTTQAAISGIPAGAAVEAAYLYWAGSGSTPDFDVAFENAAVSAAADRRYTANFTSGGTTYSFFSGVADVTALVAAKGGGTGNGSYSFSGLSVDSSGTYCAVQAVLGGWSLLVIYSHPSEEFRVVNLYEGFQTFQFQSFTLNLSNFMVPANFNRGRIAHLTWEGDPTLSGGGENLTFNGVTMSDAANPVGNQFNSISTITGTADNTSHGIDFDVYDLTAPIIQPGQTTATTTYTTGQDLVLLSAEIVAMPNSPVADLSIAMVRNDSLQLGQSASYTMTVTNNGPNNEPGPITVVDTLPTQLSYVSGGGSGWSCNVSGQTVTCTYSGGALLTGTSAPALTLNVVVASASPSSLTNTASVSGTLFDNVSGNNSASDSTTILIPRYVFTDGACVNREPFGDPAQTCNVLDWGVQTAGINLTGIYITRLDGSGVPRRYNAQRTMQFGLSCHNPTAHAGVQASFSAVSIALPLCAPNGTAPTGTVWSSISGNSNNVVFPTGSPSSGPYTFGYADVGRVELFMKESARSSADGASGAFVVRPAGFTLSGIRCTTADAANCGNGALAMVPAGSNPGATGPTGATFIRAGHPFSVTVTARNAAGNATPNYGREIVAESVLLTPAIVDAGAANNPAIGGNFGNFSAGVATGTNFTWNEVGIIRLTPSVADGDYLGAGNVTGTQTAEVGRFYPHHFGVTGSVTTRSDLAPTTTTGSINAGGVILTVASASNILKGHTLVIAGAGAGGSNLSATVDGVSGTSITLSTAASVTVSGAAVSKPRDLFTYMDEPMRLQLQVTAYSAGESVTQNYAGSYARLSLAALGSGSNWFASGCTGSSTCFGIGAINGSTTPLTARLGLVGTPAPTAIWSAGVGSFEASVLLARPTSTTPDATWGPYNTLRLGAAPRDPDDVSLPALASDPEHGMNLDADLSGTAERRELFITQSRLGRLRLRSAHGSELLPLPISVSAQYWNGSNFITNMLDNNTRFATTAVTLGNFLGNLQSGETSVLASPASVAFANGAGRYVLARPSGGDGNYGGSVDMNVDPAASGLGYLPGNAARARFGIYKGSQQFIYMRENF